MTKFLALFLSLLTLVTMSVELLKDESFVQNISQDDEIINFKPPEKLSKTLLDAEIKWQGLFQEKENSTLDKQKNETLSEYSLKVGDKSYGFYGVFNDGNVLFVLLKNEEDTFLKLTKGDVLPGQFTLNNIHDNTIVFVNNNKRVEYKLFEHKQDVKN